MKKRGGEKEKKPINKPIQKIDTSCKYNEFYTQSDCIR